MASDLTLLLSFEDPDLLNDSLEEYACAVKRGEMSEEDALSNAQALALGMLKIDVSDG